MSLKMVCRECNSDIQYIVFDNILYCSKCDVKYRMSCKECGSNLHQNIYPIKEEIRC